VLFPVGVSYRNLALHDFSSCVAVMPGLVTSGGFDCQVDLGFSWDAGSTWTAYTGIPGSGWMTFTSIGQGGQGQDLYSATLDQLNVSGGGLPFGVQFRESPIQSSTGQASVLLQDHGYQIDSFFDVWMELSLDGGMTWYPSFTTCHIVLGPFGVVPARTSTWGAIKTLYR
jgi:hypothetical protein